MSTNHPYGIIDESYEIRCHKEVIQKSISIMIGTELGLGFLYTRKPVRIEFWVLCSQFSQAITTEGPVNILTTKERCGVSNYMRLECVFNLPR